MRWVLAFHIIFVICWFAGLFYLPRLFVYHAEANDAVSNARFKIMERKLFWGIMTPSGILASAFGFWVLYANLPLYETKMWMHAKLILVGLLWLFHASCWHYLRIFKQDRNKHSHRFYRYYNEIPTVLLLIIVVLAVVK